MSCKANSKIAGLIGLAMKAGKLAAGDGRASEMSRKHKSFLVLVSSDASDNTKKKYMNMSEYHKLPIIMLDIDRYEFGRIIGREFAVVAAVCDKGFADGIVKLAERVDK